MSDAIVRAPAQPRARAPVALLGRARRALGIVPTAAALVIVLIAVIALVGPWIAPYDPNAIGLAGAHASPSSAHPLGTDNIGRDLLSRLLAGARTSLIPPLIVAALSVSAGTVIAIWTAWMGGRVDALLSRLINMGFAFPALLLAIVAVALFGKGLVAPVIGLTIAFTPYVARLTRAPALRERHMPYIAACTVQGSSGLTICARHLLPNVIPYVLAQATFLFGFALVDLAALSFLGLGVQPPQADWGAMVAQGQASVLEGHPAESLAAGLMIVLTVVAFNVVGQRLGDLAERREQRA